MYYLNIITFTNTHTSPTQETTHAPPPPRLPRPGPARYDDEVTEVTQEEEARVLGFSPEGQASFFDPGGVSSRVVDAHYSKKGSNDSYDASSSSSANSENHHDPFEPEGPPAVLPAGFRAEETPRVRELVDERPVWRDRVPDLRGDLGT